MVGAGAEMEDGLVLEALLRRPFIEMDIARAHVLMQVPFVGPVIHLQHGDPRSF
jgi:hypothetical protein